MLRTAVSCTLLIVAFATFSTRHAVAQKPTSAQTGKSQNSGVPEKQEPPQATPDLAVVITQPSKWIYAVGEGITVTVSLVAGEKGVYVSRHFGPSGGNIPGFSLTLEYPDGGFAETCAVGSFADFAAPMPSPAEVFKSEFIFLKPNEKRTIEMGISCPPKKPGVYRLQATYSPNYPQTDKVAELPEAQGLVVRETIHAQLVGIEIR